MDKMTDSEMLLHANHIEELGKEIKNDTYEFGIIKSWNMEEVKIQIGDIVIYEYKNSGTGRKYTCNVIGFNGEWIKDVNHHLSSSQSFRVKDVIIWEHKPGKIKKK